MSAEKSKNSRPSGRAENKPKRKRMGAPEEYLFKKGNQAAKGRGRPKKDHNLTKMCRMHAPECLDGLLEIIRSSSSKDSNKITAISTVLSYGFGKPKTTVDLNTTYDITADFLAALREVNAKTVDAKSNGKLPAVDVEDAEVVD